MTAGGLGPAGGGVRVAFLSKRQQQGHATGEHDVLDEKPFPSPKPWAKKRFSEMGWGKNLPQPMLPPCWDKTSMENPSKSWCHRSLPWALSLARAWLRVTCSPFCPPRPLPALDPHLQLLEEEQHVLRIPSSQPQHQGTYQCLATNPAGQHSKVFQLHVHSESPAAPHPIPFQSP